MYQIMDNVSIKSIMQHHANNVEPVLMSTPYFYTKHS